MSTLPVLTETIDNAFTHTWYEIRKEAIDNILDATVLWSALKGAGVMATQVGGKFIERTIRYGEKTTKAVGKGSIFSQGETELETAAFWTWRYVSAHVQRSIIDDQQNNGKFRIKSLVQTKLDAANEALEQKYETSLIADIVTGETGLEMQGINDLVPPFASKAIGTYGKIARSNTWWQSKYQEASANPEVNLIEDMKALYTDVHNNQTPPNLIVTTKEWYLLYENFALDLTQIIQDETTRLANLGFEALRFKGKPLIWVPNLAVSSKEQMLMLNTRFIELIYDPQMWFEMTNWKDIPLQGERIAHILCAANMIGTQPRRHGRLYEA